MPFVAREAPLQGRKALPALLLALALGSAGCFGYRPVARNMVVAPAKVRTRFPFARRVAFHSLHGDSVVLEHVVAVEGKVLEAEADSITLRPSRAWIEGSETPWRFSSAATVRLPSQGVELRKVQAGRTVAALLVFIGGIALLIGAATSHSDPTPPQTTKPMY